MEILWYVYVILDADLGYKIVRNVKCHFTFPLTRIESSQQPNSHQAERTVKVINGVTGAVILEFLDYVSQ